MILRSRRTLVFMTHAMLAIALLSGCASESNTPENTITVDVSPARVVLWQVGDTYQYSATVSGLSDATVSWSSSDTAVATVGDSGLVTAVSEGEATITASASGYSSSAQIVVDTGTQTITGKVTYDDRVYDANGFDDSIPRTQAVRFAIIDLLDADGVYQQSAATDELGNYVLPLPGSGNYQLRVLAQTHESIAFEIDISDLQGRVYAVTKDVDLTNLSQNNVYVTRASGYAGVFNMLDVFVSGAQFMGTLTAQSLPSLSVYWQEEGYIGTYYCGGFYASYCNQGAGIYVYNEGPQGDTDEYDDDVLWHEYSHFVVDNLSVDQSPGGCHFLSSNDLDLRLSWSEGFGDFFPAAIKNWLNAGTDRSHLLSIPVSDSVSRYIDTLGAYAQISEDLDTLSGEPYIFASNELAVAKVLWELSTQFSMTEIWNVMENYMPTTNNVVNIESFWDGWQVVQSVTAGELSTMEDIFAERYIYYKEDAFESDDAADALRKLALGLTEQHYLYRKDGVPDADVIAFDVLGGNTYDVATLGLANGIDTYVSVKDESGNVVATNDDQYSADAYYKWDDQCGLSRYHNDSVALSSKATFTSTSTGTYYATVTTSPDPEPLQAAGRYGTYSIRITQQ
jgi:hypothetical protein